MLKSNATFLNNAKNSQSNPDKASFMDNVQVAKAIFAKKNQQNSTKLTPHRGTTGVNQDGIQQNINDVLNAEYRGMSLYSIAMIFLIIAILWTGVQTVEQVQQYHQEYGQLQQLKKDFRALQIEHQQMLIEQQAFSATPQVTNRAVTELNMFYPNVSDRMIINNNGQEIHQKNF
ncbi:cell division protein FtsL [Faucicola mancuniensis]|uniref:cell division protein FtsL n=1 Tax=Faucicola mancuniensis TaxID=1309795 RepID=UPI0039777EF7